MRQLFGALALAAVFVALTLAATVASGAATADFTLVAHRGASGEAPEHTFAAYDLAVAQGADWIEQDVQMTRDGVLVVFHDDSLERTARGPASSCVGRLREKTYAELRQCEVGSWFNAEHPQFADARFIGERIPTIDSVLARYAGRARFYIEIKHPAAAPGVEEALLDLLRARGLIGAATRDHLIIQSFSAVALQKARALDSALALVQLLEDPILADSLQSTMTRIATYAQGIGPSRRVVTARMVEAAHAAGLFVHVYTVNDPPVLAWVQGIGADGVFTDRPGFVRASR